MADTNKNCDSCNSCNYCDSCDYCNYCNSCNSCNYCDSCDYCNYCNSCNSCNYCVGLRMSEYMIFCFGDGKYERKGLGYQKNFSVFNVFVGEEEYIRIRKLVPSIKIAVCSWIDKDKMTKEEKDNNTVWKQIGGYLKRFTYQEAWSNYWSSASKKDKEAILALPHFNQDIFEKITGITVIVANEEETGIIELNGRKYKLIP